MGPVSCVHVPWVLGDVIFLTTNKRSAGFKYRLRVTSELWTWVRAPKSATSACLCLFLLAYFFPLSFAFDVVCGPSAPCTILHQKRRGVHFDPALKVAFVWTQRVVFSGIICVCHLLLESDVWSFFHLVLAPLPQARPGGEPGIYY